VLEPSVIDEDVRCEREDLRSGSRQLRRSPACGNGVQKGFGAESLSVATSAQHCLARPRRTSTPSRR